MEKPLTSTPLELDTKSSLDIVDFIESTLELQEATRQANLELEDEILESSFNSNNWAWLSLSVVRNW